MCAVAGAACVAARARLLACDDSRSEAGHGGLSRMQLSVGGERGIASVRGRKSGSRPSLPISIRHMVLWKRGFGGSRSALAPCVSAACRRSAELLSNARPFLLNRVTGSCVTGRPVLGHLSPGRWAAVSLRHPTDGLPGRRVADQCVGWSSCYLRAREHNYRVRFLCRLPPWVRAMRPCGSTVPRRSEPGPPLPSDRCRVP